MLFRLSLFSVLAAYVANVVGHPSQPKLEPRQDPISILTTYLDYTGCSTTQRSILVQAAVDARLLAKAALRYRNRDPFVIQSPEGITVDFNSQGAIDYFGTKDRNSAYQQRIIDTLFRGSVAYRGTGLSDWWYDRYVSVSCQDFFGDCSQGLFAGYTDNSKTKSKYPLIVYCPAFFTHLKTHAEQVAAIQSDRTGQLRLNVRNLRSQATTVLHEWLHIKGTSAEVCLGGCLDTPQTLGPSSNRVQLPTYKAGLAKLLALKDPAYAANTNDNFAYFAMSQFMEQRFGVYPQYPRAWNNTKTKAENQANEDIEPGSGGGTKAWELEDSGDVAISGSTGTVVTSSPIAESPPAASEGPDPYNYDLPTDKDVVCATTSGSPLLNDCINAFKTLNDAPNTSIPHGKKGGAWWAYAQSCAITVYYKDDWSDKCGATYGDVRAHASSVFENCVDGGLGTVGGSVKFDVKNCPAEIQIIKRT